MFSSDLLIVGDRFEIRHEVDGVLGPQMRYFMRKSQITFRVVTISACLLSSACATVDMSDMTSARSLDASNATDVNVVERAAAKLYSVFTNRGFVAKDSRNKMRSAALTLLKGLENKPLNEDVNYAQSISSLDALEADIELARRYVDQTRRAAEIYLAMAPGETSLRKELASLEKSLIASKEAQDTFAEALLLKNQPKNNAEFLQFSASVDFLRQATDAFGDRVRSDAMELGKDAIG